MAGLLGLSPSTVATAAPVAATQTPAPQPQVSAVPTYTQPVPQARQLPQWTSNPEVPTNPQAPTAPVANTPTPSTPTLTQNQPDYFSQFFNSLAAIFGTQPAASTPTTPAPVANTPAVNPGATGLLDPSAFTRPDWIGQDGNTIQPTWTPPPKQPVTPVVTPSPNAAPATPGSPWAAGWDPFAEYDKANAGMLTATDPVTGRKYNPWAHQYLRPGESPFGNIDARGYVTTNGTKLSDFEYYQQLQREGSRG